MSMKENPSSLVAFFARGREIGFVIMENRELLRYGVKTIKGKRQGAAFAKRVESALSPLLKIVGPHATIVIEKTENLKRPGALCQTLSQIANRWEKEKQVYRLSLEEVKQHFCGSRKATNQELVQAIAERHPTLMPLITGAKAQKVNYWKKVFMVMALAEVAKNTCDRRKNAGSIPRSSTAVSYNSLNLLSQ